MEAAALHRNREEVRSALLESDALLMQSSLLTKAAHSPEDHPVSSHPQKAYLFDRERVDIWALFCSLPTKEDLNSTLQKL